METPLNSEGIETEVFDEDGMKSGHLAVNPRQVNIEDVVKIFEAAF